MNKTSMYKILLLAIACFSIITLSCKKQSSEEPNISTLPLFNDSIPYNLLGEGKLVFERVGNWGANSGFYVIDIDQRKCWNIECGLTHAPSVSPNGEKIAYMKWGTNQTLYDIYIMDIDGKNQLNVSNLVGQDYTPSWTFDGTQILFSLDFFYSNTNYTEALYRQSAMPNPNDRIQVIDYKTINPPNVIFGGGLVSSSSKGKLLVLADGMRTFDANGSNMKLILPQYDNKDHKIFSPSWSPDESKIAFLSYKMNSDIAVVLINPDGTNPDTLVSLSASSKNDWMGEQNQISLCWSPDGSKIAFTRPDGVEVGSHIYIIGKDHTGLKQVTFAEGATDFSLSWSKK